jgi:light-regulated signal transduction histidine kinase (bacteriophytochrome)
MTAALLAAVAVLLVTLVVVLYLNSRRTAAVRAELEATRRRALRADELLDQRTRELRQSNTDLDQFASIAAHNLQEPLRRVASFCQLLQRRYQGRLDERGDQFIAFAVDGVKRMQVLIDDLLAFSRIGQDSEEFEVVDTGEVLAAALSNLSSAINYSGAVITHGDLPKVRASESLLTAVFQNLIDNAIKFRADAPPEIHIDATRDGPEWLFSITDNGIGIDPTQADRIFTIFQRLHTRSAYPGTGIGLAVCRRIIEHHGGRIWLDPTTPQTRFTFTLPSLPTSH